MASIRYRALVALSEIFGRSRRRSHFVERVLQARYSTEAYASIEAACAFQSVAIGEFYRWKSVQWAAMTEALRLDTDGMTDFLVAHDRSSYAELDDALRRSKGILVATPHYGHFLVAIAAISDRTAGRKVVNLFFDPPEKHSANRDFAEFCERRYGKSDTVEVIFNNRSGLVRAIKALRRGEVVVIMPDVFDNIDETLRCHFLGARGALHSAQRRWPVSQTRSSCRWCPNTSEAAVLTPILGM